MVNFLVVPFPDQRGAGAIIVPGLFLRPGYSPGLEWWQWVE